ncbi:MAG: hypothetical protein IPL46_30950 [Saprospiraceae bacterium]|nr:hypothetical protein [Saprospiraceae bacterium]
MKNHTLNSRFSVMMVLIGLTLGPAASAQNHGIVIDSAVGFGAAGLRVNYAGSSGVYVHDANDDGVFVMDARLDGFRVVNAGSAGLQVDIAGGNGVQVGSAGGTGVDVGSAGGNGVYVGNAGYDGLSVFNADRWSMNIQGNRNASATPAGHIAQIYNRSTLTSPDVLALKVGVTDNPGAGANFITFFNGGDLLLGEVQGNGTGGISYVSTGADYAEYLPTLHQDEHFQPGDVIGVHQGQISRHTAGAAQVMVVTDQAAVLGNMPQDTTGYQKVSFIGQLPVRVRGPVQAGDWIVPDGQHQGVAIALSSRDITPAHQIVGQAWESSADPGVKRVNTAVGLDHSPALRQVITAQEKKD